MQSEPETPSHEPSEPSAESLAPGRLDPSAVEAAILQRRTLKVLADADHPAVIAPDVAERHRTTVRGALRISGWAPFHYDRRVDGLAEPWRAHVLWHEDCQRLAPKMTEWFPEIPPTSKILRMLYGCGALVLVTWLPQFADEPSPTPKQTAIDEEHLAAASAMVQNLLLLLTSHGMGTYWSSGGKLGDAKFFEQMGLAPGQRLLAAVFIEYPETLDDQRDRLPGKHRDSRSTGWIGEVAVPS